MTALTSAQRIGEALAGREADRIPFFLPVTMHGARAIGVPLRDYFKRPENVVEGQVRLRARLGHDVVTAFHYASLEVEAFGGESVLYEDGPANAGAPPLRTSAEVLALQPPRVEEVPGLVRTLAATRLLADRVAGDCPVLGAVVSPFSLPAMQLGLPRWFELLHEEPEVAERLIRVNEAFTTAWGNAQLAAGANLLVFFDPVASPDLVPDPIYLGMARPSVNRCLKALKGPVILGYASARGLRRIPDAVDAGALGVGGSAFESLAELKVACGGKLMLLGGLDSLALAASTPAQAAAAARAAIAAAAPGGRFLLTEHHGEIPWQVSEQALDAVAEVARTYGRYPIAPLEGDGG